MCGGAAVGKDAPRSFFFGDSFSDSNFLRWLNPQFAIGRAGGRSLDDLDGDGAIGHVGTINFYNSLKVIVSLRVAIFARDTAKSNAIPALSAVNRYPEKSARP